MNEFTRREEVRWTLISSLVLVACIAPAVLRLVEATGGTIPDQKAITAAKVASDRASHATQCSGYVADLKSEVLALKANVKAAHLDTETPDAGPPKKKPPSRFPQPTEKAPDPELAWNNAQASIKKARIVAACREGTEGLVGARPDTTAVWDAIGRAGAIAAPEESAARLEAAKTTVKLLGEAPLDAVATQTKDAEVAAQKEAERAKATAESARVVQPLPEGVLGSRRLAVGIGVGLSVLALLISYLSLRITSVRRMTLLVPLREAVRLGRPGLHAAAILRLAARYNGGEPGAVVGGALGGLLATLALSSDADVFILGVLAGMIVGFGGQWAVRLLIGATKWRARATELGEIEKPAIPIVLALSGVKPGLEAQFITFFGGLSDEDAALTVERLAAQAEEQILAAADARR